MTSKSQLSFEEMVDYIDQLERRLEVNCIHRLGGDNEIVQIDYAPLSEERREMVGKYDGITARDATIALMEKDLDAKAEEIGDLRKELKQVTTELEQTTATLGYYQNG